MLPPADPPAGSGAGPPGEPAAGPGPCEVAGPDLAMILAGAEELSEEELAGRPGPADADVSDLTDADLAVLDERLDAELARLRAGRGGVPGGEWYADPDDCLEGEVVPRLGAGFAGGGVLDGEGAGLG